jgi:hypothetical protein
MARNCGNQPARTKQSSRDPSSQKGGLSRGLSLPVVPPVEEGANPPMVDAFAVLAGERNESADADGEDDEWDTVQFDANARDILGDFGLDDEEALPEEGDFWFDDVRDLDD